MLNTDRVPPHTLIRDFSSNEIAQSLAGSGLWVDLGAATVRVRSDLPLFAEQFRCVYGNFPFVASATWADVHVEIKRPRLTRRWIKPQVLLLCDGQQPFEPFPADSALPLFEWGCNWLIAHRLNNLLLLHAGALERDGLALLLPAMPGSGKSTLTAALSQRGWRLLSDEFGAFNPDTGAFHAVLKPTALKNQSIEVIRALAPHAVFGPEFPKTRKGRVAHLAVSESAVARRRETARPGAFVLPKWQDGAATRWEPAPPHVLFPNVSFNAFNYRLLGKVGFHAALELARRCPAWILEYSDLENALACIDHEWPAVVERQLKAEQ